MTHRIAVAACLFLALAFFADALLPGRTLVPTGFLYQRLPFSAQHPGLSGDPSQQYDLLHQFYPWAGYFRESIHAGRLPLWDPHSYMGTPFWANPQAAVLFPATWLHLAFEPSTAFTLIFMLKLALALAGMCLWLRRLGLRAESCLLGALVYGLSMHTVVALAFPYSSVAVLFPWLLLALDKFLETGGARPWAWLCLALAAAAAAGQPQSSLAAFLAIGLYAAIRWQREGVRPRRLAALASAFIAAAGLTALQWMPALSYVQESMVPLGPRLIKSGLPYLPGNLMNFLAPDFFGSLLRDDFWGFPGYHDTAFYSSLIALLLAPFALWRRVGRWPSATLLAVVAGGLSLALILGIPGFESLFDLPGFNLMRRNKFVFLIVFALAALSAQGADRLAEAPRRRWLLGGALAFLGLGMLAGFAWFEAYREALDPEGNAFWSALRSAAPALAAAFLIWRRPARWTPLALTALLALDLAPLSYPLNPRGSSRALYPPLESAQRVRDASRRPLPRIFSPHTDVLSPNLAIIYGLQDVRGYDVMTPRRLFRFMQAVDPALGDEYRRLQQLDRESMHRETRLAESFDRALRSPRGEALRDYLTSESYWSVAARIRNPKLFRLLQAEFLWTRQGEPPAGYKPFLEVGPSRIYRNKEASAARLYHDWREFSSPKQALEAVEQVDPERVAVVEGQVGLRPEGEAGDPSSWEIVEATAHSTLFRVETGSPALLVQFDRYAPGWRAQVDGSPAPLLPAHALFRAVPVPPGEHQVKILYQPRPFHLGLLVSLLSLLLLLGVALASIRGNAAHQSEE